MEHIFACRYFTSTLSLEHCQTTQKCSCMFTSRLVESSWVEMISNKDIVCYWASTAFKSPRGEPQDKIAAVESELYHCDLNHKSITFGKQLLRSWLSSQCYASLSGRHEANKERIKQSGTQLSLFISVRSRDHSRKHTLSCSSESPINYCSTWMKSCRLDFEIWLTCSSQYFVPRLFLAAPSSVK